MSKIKIIGLTGQFPGCGKDTIALIIRHLLHADTPGTSLYEQEDKYERIETAIKIKSNYLLNDVWVVRHFYEGVDLCYKAITGISFHDIPRVAKMLHRTAYIETAEKMKEVFGPRVWIDALFRSYNLDKLRRVVHIKNTQNLGLQEAKAEVELFQETGTSKYNLTEEDFLPNWIIGDVRFPEEVKAIKDRGGVVFRVLRDKDQYLNERACEIAHKQLQEVYKEVNLKVISEDGESFVYAEEYQDVFDIFYDIAQRDLKKAFDNPTEGLLDDDRTIININNKGSLMDTIMDTKRALKQVGLIKNLA